MKAELIVLVLVITVLSVSGHKYGYRRYGRLYGKKQTPPVNEAPVVPVEQPIVPKVPVEQPVNICPQIVCPLRNIPLKCRKQTFTNIYGVVCKGCDIDVCEDSQNDKGPSRGDIPQKPKYINQNSWLDTTPNRQFMPNNQWQNDLSNNWQNNVPLDLQWQDNVPLNSQWQNNVPPNTQWQNNVPLDTQWQNNAQINTQWQNNILPNNQWTGNTQAQWQSNIPTDMQWQSNVPSNREIPFNSQWNANNQVVLPNQWQSGIQQKPVTFMGDIVQSIPSAKIVTMNQWNGQVSNQWQDIPGPNSAPVFKGDGNIGSPITGLPAQITGKSMDSIPPRIKSDQNLGFTNPFKDDLTFGNSFISQVYEANAPNGAFP